ncbi:MAG: hypothetical protein ACI4P6_07280 [Candidatus Spyradosoma sp.]
MPKNALSLQKFFHFLALPETGQNPFIYAGFMTARTKNPAMRQNLLRQQLYDNREKSRDHAL